ncbi:hypothetical protein [Salinisphaera sp. LB1]|uniref:hypothetical protein n=1 Tax=Salinisphaera sp. LB1 TaxID=2183911 RepID=UPI0011AB6690|nr:hypothetical protein [Salinisphaera sp. LB1]
MNYENRVVAFIDILGFKSLISNTEDKTGNDISEKIDALVEAFASIREIWDLDENSKEFLDLDLDFDKNKKVTIFSDSIGVSFRTEKESGVFYTLLEIKLLIMRLVARGIICRGAVALGKFIHTDEYLFGPALNEAYLLESRAALYPRIILDRNVVKLGARSHAPHHDSAHEQYAIEALLEQDSDGMYYIDYFFKAQGELDDPQYDFPQYIDKLGNIIRKGMMASSHPSKADLRIKFYWMRERYNRMVNLVSRSENVSALKDQGEYELAEFYGALRPIGE